MVQLHIITVATNSKYYLPYLIKSVSRNNNELKILGFRTKWKGFNYKFNLMIKHLLILPKNDIVCFIDGYDVICTRDLNNMIDSFNEIKNREQCKIIVGYDKHINKIMKLYSTWYFTNTFNKPVINSGTYIGTVEDLLNMLNIISKIDCSNIADDQILLNKYNKLYPNEIYIDTNTELFLTICDKFTELDKYITIKDNIVYSINNNKPYFIHAAFSGFLDNIIIQLGYKYDMNNMINQQIKNEYNMKIYKYIKEFFIKNKYNIIFIFIFIFYLLLLI